MRWHRDAQGLTPPIGVTNLRVYETMESVIAVVSDAVEVVSEVGNCVMVDVVVAGDT